MNKKLLFKGSLRTMARYKLRTFFMGLGVAVGVAVLVAGRSLGVGAEEEFAARVNKMFGPGTILMFGATLTESDIEAIGEQLDQVTAWGPRFGLGELDVSAGGSTRQSAVFGHTESAEFVWNRSVTDGRFFSSSDVSRSERVAVIGHRLAEILYPGSDPIGEEIMLGSVPFEVVGILEPMGIDPHGEDRDEDVYVPITTAMRRLSNSDTVGMAKLVVEDYERVDEDADLVAELLRERHRIADGEPDDFAIYTSKYAGQRSSEAIQTINTYMLVSAGVVLLVATVVISSIMLVVVGERVAEMGLRKALGAREGQIILQFFADAACLSLVFGALGIGLGLGVSYAVAGWFQMPLTLAWQPIALGLAGALVVALVASVLPARRAARLDPIVSLK